jgi:4-hydroxy-tetrahydrodipicolinate synthase
VAAVGWSHSLIARLLDAFPGIVTGMKDSSGDAEHTRKTIEAFPDFAVFPGAEVYLLAALRQGARGCISATANVNAEAIVRLSAERDSPGAEILQAELNVVRSAVQSKGLVPAAKAVLAARYRDETWLYVRPPLVPLDLGATQALLSDNSIARLIR